MQTHLDSSLFMKHPIQFRGNQVQMCPTYRHQVIARKYPANKSQPGNETTHRFLSHQMRDPSFSSLVGKTQSATENSEHRNPRTHPVTISKEGVLNGGGR